MKLSEDVKPISYFKAHASEIIRQIFGKNKTMVITQHGEAKAVVQDIHLYEQTQESLVMLKILAMSKQSLREGKSKPAKDSFGAIRNRIIYEIIGHDVFVHCVLDGRRDLQDLLRQRLLRL